MIWVNYWDLKGQEVLGPSGVQCELHVLSIERFDGTNWVPVCQTAPLGNVFNCSGTLCEGSYRVNTQALFPNPNLGQNFNYVSGLAIINSNNQILQTVSGGLQIINSQLFSITQNQTFFVNIDFDVLGISPNVGCTSLRFVLLNNIVNCTGTEQLEDNVETELGPVVVWNGLPFGRNLRTDLVATFCRRPELNVEVSVDCERMLYNVSYTTQNADELEWSYQGGNLQTGSVPNGVITGLSGNGGTLTIRALHEVVCEQETTIVLPPLPPLVQPSISCVWNPENTSVTSVVQVTGGSGNFSYSWSNNGVSLSCSGNTCTVTGLSIHTGYNIQVIITDNETGCDYVVSCSEAPVNICCPEGSIVIRNAEDLENHRNTINHSNPNRRLSVCITGEIQANPVPYVFQNCDILMTTERSALLFSEDAMFINCNIRGCDSLWNQIRMDGNGNTLRIRNTNNTDFTIRDAVWGLFIRGGSNLILDRARMTNNLICVTNGSNSLDISRSVFIGGSLLPSSQTNETSSVVGISCSMTQNVVIGNNILLGLTNEFSNFHTAISLFSTDNTTIQNNRIMNCQNGVSSILGMGANQFFNLNNNTIMNCRNGVRYQAHSLNASSNVFTRCHIGIFGNHSTGESLILRSNRYTNCNTAVFHMGIHNAQMVSIQQENVSNIPMLGQVRAGQGGGHFIFSNSENRPIIFSNNVYSNVSFGIYLGGARSVAPNINEISTIQILNNTVQLSGFQLDPDRGSVGIYLVGCSSPHLSNNTIEKHPRALRNTITLGIATDFTDNAFMQSSLFRGRNNNDRLSFGIWTGSDIVGNPQYYCNTFEHVGDALAYNEVGTSLSGLSLGTADKPVANRFRRNTINHHTYAWNSNLSTYQYFFGNQISSGPWDFYPFVNEAFPQSQGFELQPLNIIQTVQPSCNYLGGSELKRNVARGEMVSPMNRRQLMRVALMKEMIYDTTLRNIHTDYYQFYQQYRNTNAFWLALADYYAEQNDSASAVAILNGMVADTLVSQEVIELRKIQLKTELSVSDIQVLTSIGSQCDLLNGCTPAIANQLLYAQGDTSVFAKAFLPKLPNYTLPSSNKAQQVTAAEEELEEVITRLEVYPNPTDGKLHIVQNYGSNMEAQLLNAQGQVVKTFVLHEQTEISLHDLPNGLYILRSVNATFQPVKIIVNH